MDINKISDLYHDGELSKALEGAKLLVKSAPDNTDARGLLFQLYCINADYLSAEKQLDCLMYMKKSDLNASASLEILKNLLKGEFARTDYFSGSGTGPSLIPSSCEQLKEVRQLCDKFIMNWQADDDPSLTDLCIERATRPAIGRSKENTIAGEFIDTDDLMSHYLEAITFKGEYIWIAWESISDVVFDDYSKPLDLFMRTGVITYRSEDKEDPVSLKAFIPAVYPWSTEDNIDLRSSRTTEWISFDNERYAYGVGQKCYLIGDELLPILQISNLTVNTEVHGI